MGTATVLVVDDERKIRDLVRSYLEGEGYSVLVADTGQRALEAGSRVPPDLVVLDLMLPDLSGEEVARSLRTGSEVPIIMLTAKAGEDDRVAGLRLGADDYLAKPFSPRELMARVEAVLRRTNGGRGDARLSFEGGELMLDRDSREVVVAGEPVELTRSEFDLIYALASRSGRVFSRYELVNRVQGYDYEGYERTIDAHVKNLRRKLGDDSGRTVWEPTSTHVGRQMAEMHRQMMGGGALGPEHRLPITVDGSVVGTAIVRLPEVGVLPQDVSFRHSINRLLLFGGIAAGLIALLLGIVLARRATAPARELAGAARAFAAGDRTRRVGYDSPDEFGEMARSFNAMGDAVEEEDRLRRTFAAEVAHEVRTPLAILRSQVEAIQDGVVEPDPGTVASLHEETLRLTRLVGDLETLASADAAGFSLSPRPVSLRPLVEESLREFAGPFG